MGVLTGIDTLDAAFVSTLRQRTDILRHRVNALDQACGFIVWDKEFQCTYPGELSALGICPSISSRVTI